MNLRILNTFFLVILFNGVLLAQSPSFYFEQIASSGNGQVAFAVKANNFEAIGGMQYTIAWDPTVISLDNIDYNLDFLDADDFGYDNLDQGGLTLFWIDESFQGITTNNGETLYELTFNVGCGQTLPQAAIIFSDIPVDQVILQVVNGQPVEVPAAFELLVFDIDSPFQIDGQVSDVLCNTAADGSIDQTVTGNAPFTFDWSNGPTTEDLFGIPAGLYACVVTDDSGCSFTAMYEVSEPEAIEIEPAVVNSTCGQANGAVEITIMGGVSPYTYNWSNGSTNEDIIDLPAGNYMLTVTDSNNCSATDTYDIDDMPQDWDVNDVVGQNVSCFDSNDGSIDLSIIGNPSNLTYSWSNGASTQDVSGLPPGEYFCTISDNNGCSSISPAVTITEPDALTQISVDITPDNENQSTGSIDLAVTGGTGAYTYLWTNNATTASILGLSAGDYSCTVTDAIGCTAIFGPFEVESIVPTQTVSNKSKLNCYPNPSQGNVFLEVIISDVDDFSMHVYNVLGQKVYFQDNVTNNTRVEIPSEEWGAGTYYVSLRSENSVVGSTVFLLN